MKKAEVIAGCKSALKDERECLARFLGYLEIVDREQWFLEEGYSSLYRFCTEELGLSKNCALKRIAACRLVRRFPELLGLVEEGKLHLSAIVMLSPHVTEDNHAELFALAQGKTEEKLERELAARFPRATSERVASVRWVSGGRSDDDAQGAGLRRGEARASSRATQDRSL